MPLDQNAPSSVAPEDIAAIIRGVAPVIREDVASELAKRDRRIAELEQKLLGIEARREVADVFR
jgi:hypothetical protein